MPQSLLRRTQEWGLMDFLWNLVISKFSIAQKRNQNEILVVSDSKCCSSILPPKIASVARRRADDGMPSTALNREMGGFTASELEMLAGAACVRLMWWQECVVRALVGVALC